MTSTQQNQPDALRLMAACKVGRILGGHDAGVPRWPLPVLAKQMVGTMEQIKLQAVEAALKRHGGVVRFAAAELNISRLTIYEILKRAGRKNPCLPSNIVRLAQVAALVVVMVVCGCAQPKADRQVRPTGTTYENTKSHQVPRPPLPRTPRSSTGSEANHVARAVSAPVGPPAPRWMAWENWPGARIAVIEKSPDMVTWTQIGRVTNQTHFWVSFDGARGFYRVGHPAHETHHWFDPVLEIYKCDLE